MSRAQFSAEAISDLYQMIMYADSQLIEQLAHEAIEQGASTLVDMYVDNAAPGQWLKCPSSDDVHAHALEYVTDCINDFRDALRQKVAATTFQVNLDIKIEKNVRVVINR